MKRPSLQSQITFLYYRDLARATRFYEDVLQLELCDDQGDARIYRVAEKAFVGIVDGAKGHCQAQETNAVLVTLVTENVEDWYAYLRDCGVKLLTEVKQPEGFPVECFFFEDPEGYQYEVQRFLDPKTARRFQC
jgi:predicted enzyme related to lactoylglutathione lyase